MTHLFSRTFFDAAIHIKKITYHNICCKLIKDVTRLKIVCSYVALLWSIIPRWNKAILAHCNYRTWIFQPHVYYLWVKSIHILHIKANYDQKRKEIATSYLLIELTPCYASPSGSLENDVSGVIDIFQVVRVS